ncbi:MAG: metal ABC transporter ATP-binding protein [Clostridia bacterium]|nr:metal ABC transporter ATP-binding protein [Clostridia bacterium]
MEWLAEAVNVRFGYGDRTVLKQVSFAVGPGEFVGIIGSNGTGKSTLLRLLLGSLRPDAGTIRILGREVRDSGALPGVGYVPQQGLTAAAGFPATAGEIVLSGLYSRIGAVRPARARHREAAARALARVGLPDAARTPVGAMSGGQLQRVLLARVLVAEPRLLLMDEPLTGLDEEAAGEMYTLLRRLSREDGVAVLMVTHDLARASGCLDRVLCLEYGILVEVDIGQIEHELRHRHRHPGVGGLPTGDADGPVAPHAVAPACGWPVPGAETETETEGSHGNP